MKSLGISVSGISESRWNLSEIKSWNRNLGTFTNSVHIALKGVVYSLSRGQGHWKSSWNLETFPEILESH